MLLLSSHSKLARYVQFDMQLAKLLLKRHGKRCRAACHEAHGTQPAQCGTPLRNRTHIAHLKSSAQQQLDGRMDLPVKICPIDDCRKSQKSDPHAILIMVRYQKHHARPCYGVQQYCLWLHIPHMQGHDSTPLHYNAVV